MEEPRTLQDLITLAQQRHKARWMTELERIGKAAGFTINHTTLNKLQTGKYLSAPTRKTCEALAFLSGVPLARVMKIADVGSGRTVFSAQLPRGVDKLTGARLRAAIDILKVLVEAEETIQGDYADRANGVTDSVIHPAQSEHLVAYATDEDIDGLDELTPSDQPG